VESRLSGEKIEPAAADSLPRLGIFVNRNHAQKAAVVVLLRNTHRIRVVRLTVVAHPESTHLELRFDLFFGETVVITAAGHVVAGFQGLRAPAP
jgi:hypothetical protein